MDDQVESVTYQSYHLRTCEGGRIVGETETNDPEDRGEATGVESWAVSYKSFEAMKRATGLSHIGCMGCRVDVFLDGKRI